ncbi:MAG: S1 RNA-binding domain-containing protein, partial [Planctomycetota bacterium]
VSNVGTIVKEGQEVDVKVLSVDPEAQRMSLSMKAVQAAPEPTGEDSTSDTPADGDRKPAVPQHRGPLKGGLGRSSGGEQFGLKW